MRVEPLAACRDAIGASMSDFNMGLFGRWGEAGVDKEWCAWAETCTSTGGRPFLVRPQYYAGTAHAAIWSSWRNRPCDADLSLHNAVMLERFVLRGDDALQNCKSICNNFHNGAAKETGTLRKAVILAGCRTVLFWNATGECQLFSPGCVPMDQKEAADEALLLDGSSVTIGLGARPGSNHWTDIGSCIPSPCIGAEAEDFVIWCSRGLVSHPVFRWQVAEMDIHVKDQLEGLSKASGFDNVGFSPDGAMTGCYPFSAGPFPRLAFVQSDSVVCIEGPASGVESKTLESQLRHFVLPTGSQVVVNVEVEDIHECSDADALFRAVLGARIIHFHCEPNIGEERSEFHGFLEEVRTYLQQNGNYSLAKVDEFTYWINHTIESKLFLAPEHQKLSGSATNMFLKTLRNVRGKQACRNLLEDEEIKRGSPFNYVGYSRPDDYYITPYPAVELLQGEGIWIPEGDDWGGLNDRHAWGRRDSMMAYFSRYMGMVSGELWHEIYVHWDKWQAWSLDELKLNPELLLRLHVAKRGIPVRRFLPVSSRRCSSVHGSVKRPCPLPSITYSAVGFRDPFTVTDAYNTARLVRFKGYLWARNLRSRPVLPSCEDWYASHTGVAKLLRAELRIEKSFRMRFLPSGLTLRLCCNEDLFGLGGLSWCWNEPIYDFSRCCTTTFELSVVPPACHGDCDQTMQDASASCWLAEGSIVQNAPEVRICP